MTGPESSTDRTIRLIDEITESVERLERAYAINRIIWLLCGMMIGAGLYHLGSL